MTDLRFIWTKLSDDAWIYAEYRNRPRFEYAVMLRVLVAGRWQTIRLFDNAHGRNEMHRTCLVRPSALKAFPDRAGRCRDMTGIVRHYVGHVTVPNPRRVRGRVVGAGSDEVGPEYTGTEKQPAEPFLADRSPRKAMPATIDYLKENWEKVLDEWKR